jgi:hypothetical protein
MFNTEEAKKKQEEERLEQEKRIDLNRKILPMCKKIQKKSIIMKNIPIKVNKNIERAGDLKNKEDTATMIIDAKYI